MEHVRIAWRRCECCACCASARPLVCLNPSLHTRKYNSLQVCKNLYLYILFRYIQIFFTLHVYIYASPRRSTVWVPNRSLTSLFSLFILTLVVALQQFCVPFQQGMALQNNVHMSYYTFFCYSINSARPWHARFESDFRFGLIDAIWNILSCLVFKMFLKGLLSESYWVQNSSSTFVFNGDILFQRNTANSECIFEGYCPFCQCYIILKEQWWYISVEQIYFALRATNTTLHD